MWFVCHRIRCRCACVRVHAFHECFLRLRVRAVVSSGGFKMIYIAFIAAGSVFLLLIVTVIIVFCVRKAGGKKRHKHVAAMLQQASSRRKQVWHACFPHVACLYDARDEMTSFGGMASPCTTTTGAVARDELKRTSRSSFCAHMSFSNRSGCSTSSNVLFAAAELAAGARPRRQHGEVRLTLTPRAACVQPHAVHIK